MQHIKSKHILKEPDCQETNETRFTNVAPPSQFASKESWRVLKKRTQISLLLQNVAGWDESKTYTSSVNSDGLDSTQSESAEKLRRLTWIARKKEFTTCKQCSFPFSSLAFLAKAGLIYIPFISLRRRLCSSRPSDNIKCKRWELTLVYSPPSAPTHNA